MCLLPTRSRDQDRDEDGGCRCRKNEPFSPAPEGQQGEGGKAHQGHRHFDDVTAPPEEVDRLCIGVVLVHEALVHRCAALHPETVARDPRPELVLTHRRPQALGEDPGEPARLAAYGGEHVRAKGCLALVSPQVGAVPDRPFLGQRVRPGKRVCAVEIPEPLPQRLPAVVRRLRAQDEAGGHEQETAGGRQEHGPGRGRAPRPDRDCEGHARGQEERADPAQRAHRKDDSRQPAAQQQ